MSIIISDKDKLIQDLGKRMTKVTDDYSTTHVVVHWGDVQEIVEKFFRDKNSDWLIAKDEPNLSEKPNSSEKPNNCELQTIRCPKCGRTDYIRDMEKDMGIKDSHYKYKCINCNFYIKTEPTISKMEQVKDDAYFLELMGAVERGEISDAEANQAWYEYINQKDEPQTEKCDRPQMDCENCWKELHCRVKDEPQTERSENE